MLFLVSVREAVAFAAAWAFHALVARAVDGGFAGGLGARGFAEEAVRCALPCRIDGLTAALAVVWGLRRWCGCIRGAGAFMCVCGSVIEAVPSKSC